MSAGQVEEKSIALEKDQRNSMKFVIEKVDKLKEEEKKERESLMKLQSHEDLARTQQQGAEEKCARVEKELAVIKEEFKKHKAENQLLKTERNTESGRSPILEQLKRDNAMLMSAINSTGPQGKTGEYTHKVKPIHTQSAKSLKNRHSKELLIAEEKENQVPDALTEGLRIVGELTSKKGNQMTDTFISELMGELNRAWHPRGAKTVGSVKHSCGTAITDLKRQVNMQVPMNEMHQKRSIARLKEDIKRVKEDVKNNIADKSSRTRGPGAIKQVDYTMVEIAEVNMDCKRAIQENASLRNTVDKMQSTLQEGQGNRWD